jgi:hypothetical protein
LLSVREAASALRTALDRDPEALSALFSHVFNTSPYERPDEMLDAFEEALGYVFPGDTEPSSWARLLVARARPAAPRGSQSKRDAVSVASPRSLAPRAWIALELVRERGGAVALARCLVETANGEVHSLSTDTQGQLRLEGIAPGPCKVSLPELDGDAWSAPGQSVRAHERAEAVHVVKQGESLVRIAHQHGPSRSVAP